MGSRTGPGSVEGRKVFYCKHAAHYAKQGKCRAVSPAVSTRNSMCTDLCPGKEIHDSCAGAAGASGAAHSNISSCFESWTYILPAEVGSFWKYMLVSRFGFKPLQKQFAWDLFKLFAAESLVCVCRVSGFCAHFLSPNALRLWRESSVVPNNNRAATINTIIMECWNGGSKCLAKKTTKIEERGYYLTVYCFTAAAFMKYGLTQRWANQALLTSSVHLKLPAPLLHFHKNIQNIQENMDFQMLAYNTT